MRIYEKTTKTIEQNVLKEVHCDICGKKAAKGGWQWGTGYYEVNETEIEVTIKHKEGESYPEGGSGVELGIDMCPTCFKDKLIPWIKSQGANLNYQEWDW